MEWKTTWRYLPLNYGTTIGTLAHITQRTTFWNNMNGNKVRVKFTNLYGTKPLRLKEVVIAQKKQASSDVLNSTYLTLNNAREILILPGQEFYSDAAELDVRAGMDLVISIDFEESTAVNASCCNWSKESWHTEYILEGKHLQSYEVFPFIDDYLMQADLVVGISEIGVLTDENVKIVTLFGDSITHMSFYSDALSKMLYKKFPGKVSVLNNGIGGNKMLTDASYVPDIPGNGQASGNAALKRFEQDVYGSETPDYVFILEGVNDLMHPYLFNKLETMPRVEALISAYLTLASIARKYGSKVYFSTILPLKHEMTAFGPEGEAIRCTVNAWIRNQTVADGVFDFALVTGKDTESMKDDLHIGDGLHPNKAGGIVMAQTVFNDGGLINGINTD